MASTSARIGVGRAGPRYKTNALLLFQGDHAVTQDALYRDVDQKLLDEFNLFTVQTKVTGGKQEFLPRPDLGRLLNDDAKRIINEKCQKNVKISTRSRRWIICRRDRSESASDVPHLKDRVCKPQG